jgi:hypothetical protein
MSWKIVCRRHVMLAGVLLAWLGVVIGGWLGLSAYAQRAGADSSAPPRIERLANEPAGRFRLMMFVHPHCGCSLSSMRELERTLARCQGRVAAEIYFFRPLSVDDNWTHGALWNLAANIPDASIQVDPSGAQAHQFAVKTSGSVLLYDPQGRLCFQGGLTASRGHEGDSAGKAAIIAIAHGKTESASATRVFGCALSTGYSRQNTETN